MSWTVLFHSAFDAEFANLQDGVQDELLAQATMNTCPGSKRKEDSNDHYVEGQDGRSRKAAPAED